jgi:hypothetical protein
MSSYLCLHIGPYLVVRKVPTKVDDVRQVCVNSDCTQFELKAKQPFCSRCGEKTQHKTFQKDDYKSVDDVISTDYEKYEDLLCRAHNGGSELSDEWDIWIPNHHIPNGCKVDEDSSESFAEIKPDRMQIEKDWFVEQYAEFFTRIKQELGEENVTIQWGIVKHYN